VLDLSDAYRKTFDDELGHATQVADPIHLVKLANTELDECRRRIPNDTLGHRGRRTTRCVGPSGVVSRAN
jgi:transposase